ncbi:MAG TPA: glycosyltransferase 87 family protein [Gaiellaceae bacterium]|nr:glycosyltransferase 87 family protein [Gaiellaceae bacterium]
MTRRTSVILALAGSVAFVVACLLVEQGLTDSSLYSDVHVYAAYASKMAGGGVPYRDFSDEYPPLAQPVFLLARIAGASNFALAFKAFMALCGAGALVCAVFTLRALRAAVVHAVAAVAVIAASPLLVGPIFLNAYDLWPAFLLSLALLLLVRGRASWAFAVFGAAVAAKVYPLAVLPVAVLSIDRALRRRALLTFLAVLVLVHLPFAVLGPGGLRYSYEVQARRGLELNSLGASILLASGHPQLANQPPGSLNVTGATATAFAVVSSVLVVAAIAAAAWAYHRGRLSLIAASAAAVAGFVAFNKVFSAQYVDWLVPLVPLVSIGAAVGSIPALVLTRLVFSHRSHLANVTDVPLLLARNAFVVALFVALLWQGTVPFSTRDRR